MWFSKLIAQEHSLLAIEGKMRKWKHVMTLFPHPLGQSLFWDPRDQLLPGSFLLNREEPGTRLVMRLLVIFGINWFGVKLKFNYKGIYIENHLHVRFQIIVPNHLYEPFSKNSYFRVCCRLRKHLHCKKQRNMRDVYKREPRNHRRRVHWSR
jgi:hypothetical protein